MSTIDFFGLETGVLGSVHVSLSFPPCHIQNTCQPIRNGMRSWRCILHLDSETLRAGKALETQEHSCLIYALWVLGKRYVRVRFPEPRSLVCVKNQYMDRIHELDAASAAFFDEDIRRALGSVMVYIPQTARTKIDRRKFNGLFFMRTR